MTKADKPLVPPAGKAAAAGPAFPDGGFIDRSNIPPIKKPLEEQAMLGHAFEDQPLWKRLNYIHVVILLGTPMLAIYGAFTTALKWETFAWSVAYYFFSGLGITAGYHRLFAHRCFKAVPVFRWLLMLMGSAAVEGSIRWWCRDHRAHHRYVDTDRDPYSASEGFFYSHCGWMFIRQDWTKIGKVDIQDFQKDTMIHIQHKYYGAFAIVMGYLVPAAVAGLLWDDWAGGFFFAGCARLFFVHQSTFFVNSLAHHLGTQSYSDGHTARDSLITALLTLGEGLHNFHHEFPSDYRNGYRWYQYDPTKVFIYCASLLGLAYDLQTFPEAEIEKGLVQMRYRAAKEGASSETVGEVLRASRGFYWGPSPDVLPKYTMADVAERVEREGAQLLVLHGHLIDVAGFVEEHPGGAAHLTRHFGRDVSKLFVGQTYKHSNAAHNLMHTLRVGVVTDAPSSIKDVAVPEAKAD